MKRLFILLVISAAMFILAAGVSAKSDFWVEDQEDEWGDFDSPTEFPEPRLFMAFYGQLDDADDIDVFSMTFDEANTDWGLNFEIPECAGHFSDFEPDVAIVGAGIEPKTTSQRSRSDADLPFDLPEDMGVIVFDDLSLHFFDFPAPGTYFMVIWEPDGDSGAYTLYTGNLHPESYDFLEDKQDMWEQIEDGSWMGVECTAFNFTQ